MGRIELDGTRNTRDLSGIENIYGMKIKENYFIRTDNLNKLSDRDIEILVNKYNLRTIIDLRTDTEIKELPNREIENVKYFHIPILKSTTAGITKESEIENEQLKSIPNLKILYPKMVTDEFSVLQLKKIIETIIEEDSAILFHCTAGKDRTGIVSMLILSMLDVHEDKIMEEYLETNFKAKPNSEREYKEILEKTNDKELAESIRRLCIADEEYLNSAINAIKKDFGTVKDFIINKFGISQKTIDIFKEKVLI